jgi:hypothetical protein
MRLNLRLLATFTSHEVCGGSRSGTMTKAAASLVKDFARRYFYAVFKAFTLAELITLGTFPQHLVAYPQPYQHVDNLPIENKSGSKDPAPPGSILRSGGYYSPTLCVRVL